MNASIPGSILFFFSYETSNNNATGILVTTPSGEAHCGGKDVTLPAQSGSYSVWLRSKVSGDPVEAEVVATYLAAP